MYEVLGYTVIETKDVHLGVNIGAHIQPPEGVPIEAFGVEEDQEDVLG